MKEINFGELVKEEVTRQGLTITQFAKLIHTTRSNAYGIFGRKYIDPALLAQISIALRRNFLAEMAQHVQAKLEEDPEETKIANSKLKSLVHPLEKKLEGRVYSEATFTKDREGLKVLLKEYFESDHRIPLLILETGYTFGAREVVKQVANEVFPGTGSTPCPKLLEVSRMKFLPDKVLIDYIDCNTFGSIEASEQRLNDICWVQNDVNKKLVCIIHTNPIVSWSATGRDKSFDLWGSEMSIFLSRYEQFFITVYSWSRNSLLSWATDTGLHEYVLNYIHNHKIPDGVRKDYQLENAHVSFFEMALGLPALHHGIDYPTPQAYLPSEWQYVSDFINTPRNIGQELHLRHFIQDIIDFNEMDKAEYLATRTPQMKRIECDIDVEGVLVDGMSIVLPIMTVGAISYLHDQALATDLKGLDEEAALEQFFPWLEQHHPQLAQGLIKAAEVELVDLLAEPDSDYYRDNIPHDPPHSIDSYWTIQPGLKYNIMLYNLPKWK